MTADSNFNVPTSTIKRQLDRADILANILLFGWNWQVNLSKRLENAETIGSYPNKNECSNYVLSCLINSYVDHTIEQTLNQFYQAVKLIQKYDTSFRYKADESDPIGLLMAYRNKLIAHAIENKISGESDKYSQLLKTWPRIFRDIEAGGSNGFEWDQFHRFTGPMVQRDHRRLRDHRFSI